MEMVNRLGRTAAFTALLFAATHVSAGIISTTNVDIIAPPASVLKNVLVGDPPKIFQEQANLALTTDFNVDITGPGTFNSDPGNTLFTDDLNIDSYYLHFDIQGNAPGNETGAIEFDQDVLAIIGDDALLFASHSLLGHSSVTYWSGAASLHGTWDSGTSPGDFVSLSADRRTVDFRFVVGTAIDSIRIITNASEVPEPTTLGLLAGAVLLVNRRRRRA